MRIKMKIVLAVDDAQSSPSVILAILASYLCVASVCNSPNPRTWSAKSIFCSAGSSEFMELPATPPPVGKFIRPKHDSPDCKFCIPPKY